MAKIKKSKEEARESPAFERKEQKFMKKGMSERKAHKAASRGKK